jgi:hypothetical protein
MIFAVRWLRDRSLEITRLKHGFEPLAQRPCLLHPFFTQGRLYLANKGFSSD